MKYRFKNISIAALLSGAAAGYLLLSYKFWWCCDDAFISFRFARNLAEGYGLRYNLGESPPIEGYSNFLWVLVGAAAHAGGGAIEKVLPQLSLLCGIILLVLLWATMRGYQISALACSCAIFVLALFPPFAVWSSSGLETMPAALCLLSSFHFLFRSKTRRAGFWCGLSSLGLALLRVEGLAWVLLLLLLGFVYADNRKKLMTAAGISLLGYAAYFFWRHNYYGAFVANTVVNKVGFDLLMLGRGFKYSALFLLTFFPAILVLPGLYFALKKGWQAFPAVTMFIALCSFPILVGGDFMAMGRFFVSALPFGALMLAFMLDRLMLRRNGVLLSAALVAPTVLFNLLAASDNHALPEGLLRHFQFRTNVKTVRSEREGWDHMRANTQRWSLLGKELARLSDPGDSLVMGAVGSVGYFSSLHIFDRFGLVDSQVARQEALPSGQRSPGHDKLVPPSFFLNDKPTYLSAALIEMPAQKRTALKTFEEWRAKSEYADYQGVLIDTAQRSIRGQKYAVLLLCRKPCRASKRRP